MTKKQIAVITPESDAIAPKPTKREVIEALVIAAMKKRDIEILEAQTKNEELQEAVNAYLAQNLKHMAFKISSFYYPGRDELSVTVNVKLKDAPELKTTVKRYESHKIPNRLFEDDARREIKRAIDCNPKRVEALSQSPEIGEMLRQITSVTATLKDAS